jgi:hypothetical protein
MGTRERERSERLHVMMSAEELAAVDEFRFENSLPSRAAAVRELMRRGLLPAHATTPSRLVPGPAVRLRKPRPRKTVGQRSPHRASSMTYLHSQNRRPPKGSRVATYPQACIHTRLAARQGQAPSAESDVWMSAPESLMEGATRPSPYGGPVKNDEQCL